jgi:hypothetical protein
MRNDGFFEKRREKQKRRGKNGKKKMTDAGGWAVNVRSLGEKVGPEKFSTSYFLGVEISTPHPRRRLASVYLTEPVR